MLCPFIIFDIYIFILYSKNVKNTLKLYPLGTKHVKIFCYKILVLNVKSKILAMVIEYCTMHVEAGLDAEFVKVNYSDYLTVKAIECSKKLFNEVNEAWGVTGNVLAKGIDYCEKHVDDAAANASSSDLKVWDAKFVRHVDMDTLCDLMLAANYLNIKGLLDLTCRAVPDHARREKEQIFFKFAIALVLFWIFFG